MDRDPRTGVFQWRRAHPHTRLQPLSLCAHTPHSTQPPPPTPPRPAPVSSVQLAADSRSPLTNSHTLLSHAPTATEVCSPLTRWTTAPGERAQTVPGPWVPPPRRRQPPPPPPTPMPLPTPPMLHGCLRCLREACRLEPGRARSASFAQARPDHRHCCCFRLHCRGERLEVCVRGRGRGRVRACVCERESMQAGWLARA